MKTVYRLSRLTGTPRSLGLKSKDLTMKCPGMLFVQYADIVAQELKPSSWQSVGIGIAILIAATAGVAAGLTGSPPKTEATAKPLKTASRTDAVKLGAHS